MVTIQLQIEQLDIPHCPLPARHCDPCAAMVDQEIATGFETLKKTTARYLPSSPAWNMATQKRPAAKHPPSETEEVEAQDLLALVNSPMEATEEGGEKAEEAKDLQAAGNQEPGGAAAQDAETTPDSPALKAKAKAKAAAAAAKAKASAKAKAGAKAGAKAKAKALKEKHLPRSPKKQKRMEAGKREPHFASLAISLVHSSGLSTWFVHLAKMCPFLFSWLPATHTFLSSPYCHPLSQVMHQMTLVQTKTKKTKRKDSEHKLKNGRQALILTSSRKKTCPGRL